MRGRPRRWTARRTAPRWVPWPRRSSTGSGQPGGRREHARIGEVLAVLVRVAEPDATVRSDDEFGDSPPGVVDRRAPPGPALVLERHPEVVRVAPELRRGVVQ